MMIGSVWMICGMVFLAVMVQGSLDNMPENTQEAMEKYKIQIFDQNLVVKGDDWGHLDNCGDARHNFTFQWTPKKFKVGDTVTINLDFVAQATIIQATASVTVWAKGVEDPIIKTDVQITCAQVKMYFPEYSKYCPLKQGEHFPLKGVKFPVPSSYPIPAGTYIVKVDIHDQDGQPVICAKGEVQTLDPPPINWNDWRR